jgi:peptidoglycan hydrolase-like protein with peptidoglycan-binding domain
MAKAILDFEARRDNRGRLQIYKLPPGDGGGTYEVAGINDRYHPVEAAHLAALIKAGRFDEAESDAEEIVATYTDFVTRWTDVSAVESYLRDSGFNRGPGGAARIFQRSIGVPDRGVVSHANIDLAKEKDANDLLQALRKAREDYERDVAHRDESSKFWKGLVNRWNKALAFAQTFLPSADQRPAVIAQGKPTFNAAEAVIAEAVASSQTGTASVATAATAPVASLLPSQAPIAIPALRLGTRGDLVRAWQSFLTGQNFDPGGLDGVFGDKTYVATKAFQSEHGLVSDGVAGRETMLKAMDLGFELIEEPASDISGSNFPPRPDYAPLEDTAARQAIFGKYTYVADPQPRDPEHIRIVGSWETDNIIFVPLPQMRKAMGHAAPSGMSFHKLAAKQLVGMWADWESAGLLDRILSFDGSFNPRFIRGSRTVLSNHAFGTAFDINEPENKLGTRPPLVGQPGSTRELVPIANKWGFYWGGHFGSRPDGMHFEIAVLK